MTAEVSPRPAGVWWAGSVGPVTDGIFGRTNPILVFGWGSELRVDFIVRRKQSCLQDIIGVVTDNASQPEHVMKLTIPAATLLAGAALASATPTAQASPGNQGLSCIAKVIHSEELPFAPIGNWLVKVTLEITPPNGNAYQTTLQDWMPWQGPPPRRGQAFRVQCDPANPKDLHLVSQAAARTAF
jgi:hypothetical protein